MRKEIYLDLSFINTPLEFHQEVSKLLSFPSYYDNSLDHFWDCLNSYIDPNLTIYINNYEKIDQIFGVESPGMREVFERANQEIEEMSILFN